MYFLSLLKVDHRHAMFLESPFKSCYQSLLTMLRLFRNVTPIASTMTIRAESVGGPAVLRCFLIISVFKYLHANFAILLEMTELKKRPISVTSVVAKMFERIV